MQSEHQLMVNTKIKMDTNLQSMTDQRFTIGIMLILKILFQVPKLADGTAYGGGDRITVINGSHSFINHLMIKSAGKIVYDTDNLHKVSFVKNLLEYSDDFSRSVAKNGLWYLDTSHQIANANQNAGFEARRRLTVGNADVNVIIPVNRYSFFEVLEDKMLIPMQLQFNITLQNDDELIQKADAADDGRVAINRFLLWVPKLIPKDSLYDNFVSSFLKETKWSYLRSSIKCPLQHKQVVLIRFQQVWIMLNIYLYISKEIKQMSWQKILTYLILIN